MYGETEARMLRFSATMGLSPHVRGNLLHGIRQQFRAGSIPACTGKPRRCRFVRLRRGWVYPRMYGETGGTVSKETVFGGLSPHVRGNLLDEVQQRVDVGSIPACTGKPHLHLVGPHPVEVYPRMYGETVDGVLVGVDVLGLSPHVRGNRSAECDCRRRQRSIPACTGKPRNGAPVAAQAEVYPRMYGETPDRYEHRDPRWGLSPHVRGNHRSGAGGRVDDGSIPACTGKPPE